MTRRSQVSVHLVFPAGRPPALGAISRIQGDCAASDLQWRQAETERRKRRMTYPINVARNVARTVANTSRVLVSDIELLPSARLASGFMEMVHQRPPKHGVVFVVPVFEIESNEPPPETKSGLLAACQAGLAVYFHRYMWNLCRERPKFEIVDTRAFSRVVKESNESSMSNALNNRTRLPLAGSFVRTVSDFPGWPGGCLDRTQVGFDRLSSPRGNIHIIGGSRSLSARATIRSIRRRCLGRASRTRWPRYKAKFPLVSDLERL